LYSTTKHKHQDLTNPTIELIDSNRSTLEAPVKKGKEKKNWSNDCCHQLRINEMSEHLPKQAFQVHIDAILFLISEYTLAYKSNPSLKSLSLTQFWQQEYSKEALLQKASQNTLNPRFVADILGRRGTGEMRMLSVLAEMQEEMVKGLVGEK
jgi:hypothetical protein